MQLSLLPPDQDTEKTLATLSYKILGQPLPHQDEDSIVRWANAYFEIQVKGSPLKTEQAKHNDLGRFLSFYLREVGHEHVGDWTPAVTKAFQKQLIHTVSLKTQQPYKPATVNRIMATLRHFARWLDKQRPFSAGSPFDRVTDVTENTPDWNGLTDRQLMRLKSGVDQRIAACTRADQNPLLEAAVFYVLLNTGLRESELVALQMGQYRGKGFYNVYRKKGKVVTDKVPLPKEGRDFLERYLEDRYDNWKQAGAGDPIFVTRFGTSLAERDVQRVCERISRQAYAHVPPEEKFKLKPHQLRHTFLKKCADKYGLNYAFTMSGNKSIKEIFGYTRPSQDEMDQAAEEVFG